MDEFRICSETQVTGFLDGLGVKNEGTDKANWRNLDIQETGEEQAVLQMQFEKPTLLE